MNLTIQEIFLLFHNFEPSRTKLWEFVRRFDPIQMCAFLYLLENVVHTPKKVPLTLPDTVFESFYRNLIRENTNVEFNIVNKLKLNLDRVCERDHILFSIDDENNNQRPVSLVPDNTDMLTLLKIIVEDSSSPLTSSSKEFTINEKYSMYLRMIVHNLSTHQYRAFLENVRFLLFPDHLQDDRSEFKQNESIVVTYLRYYKMLTFQPYVIDPKMFKYLFVQKPLRVYNNNELTSRKYIIQHYYQGYYVIIDSSLTNRQVKCFNRYGEQNRLILLEKFNCDCTFEAVLVPLDARRNPRSWRYWPYRSDYRIYKTDVFRYGNSILTNVPFAERIKYLDLIKSPNSVSADCIFIEGNNITSTSNIELDMYNHVVGKFIRRANAFCNERAYVYKFPINSAFDAHKNLLLEIRMTDFSNKSFVYNSNIHVSFETADRKTICIAYAHSSTHYFLCSYNDRLHQFEHSGDLQRLVYDNCSTPRYRTSERLLVLNCKERPRGILFLRVYFTKFGEIVGYESKCTTSRYDLPLRNELLETVGLKLYDIG